MHSAAGTAAVRRRVPCAARHVLSMQPALLSVRLLSMMFSMLHCLPLFRPHAGGGSVCALCPRCAGGRLGRRSGGAQLEGDALAAQRAGLSAGGATMHRCAVQQAISMRTYTCSLAALCMPNRHMRHAPCCRSQTDLHFLEGSSHPVASHVHCSFLLPVTTAAGPGPAGRRAHVCG